MYHHLAHLNSVKRHIRKGTKVRRGDIIGEVGKSGTKYAHLHYEVRRSKPDSWTQYIWGMTRDQVKAQYPDPDKWISKIKNIPAKYNTYGGWEYLDPINKAGTAFHPGVDINSGWGDQDLGNPIKAPCNGEIVYYQKNEGGWGTHIWIKEEEKAYPQIDWDFAKKIGGKFYLQVEGHGEAWYIDPDGKRFYMGATPQEMLEFVQKNATGISNDDLNKIPKG